MHQIIRDNPLDIGLYNSLYYRGQAVLTVWTVLVSCNNNFSSKHGSGSLGYGSTSKIMRTTYTVLRTTYHEQRNSYRNVIKLQI